MSTNKILEIKNLTHTYAKDTPFQMTAISDISFDVYDGDFVGIIGHTGSGKSTLVQHLNGLLKPTSGGVYFAGKDIWEKPKEMRAIRFKIGVVFQYPEHQLFENTVYRDIAFGPKNMGLSEEEIDLHVRGAAHFVGLKDELLTKSPFDLSGGEKRRVAIAGVMAMFPKVLVLDEPTAGLDPKGKEVILNQIQAYQKENGSTTIIVSHSMEDIARVANKVVVMNKGTLAMYDEVSKIFSRGAELEKMGLSVPAVTKIYLKLREKGLLEGVAYTVDQAVQMIMAKAKKEGKI